MSVITSRDKLYEKYGISNYILESAARTPNVNPSRAMRVFRIRSAWTSFSPLDSRSVSHVISRKPFSISLAPPNLVRCSLSSPLRRRSRRSLDALTCSLVDDPLVATSGSVSACMRAARQSSVLRCLAEAASQHLLLREQPSALSSVV